MGYFLCGATQPAALAARGSAIAPSTILEKLGYHIFDARNAGEALLISESIPGT